MEPFFRIPRALVSSHAWSAASVAVRCVFVTVYQLAGYRSNEWAHDGQRYDVEPGQFVTSLASLSEQSGKGVSIKHVRIALRILETGGFVRSEASPTGRRITVLLDVSGGQRQGKDRADPRADPPNPETQTPPASPAASNRERADPRAGIGQAEGNYIRKRKRNSNTDDRFEAFWAVYPKRVEKAAAYRCWVTRVQEGYTPEQMIQAAEAYARECADRDPKYIKHPRTFLGPDKPFLDRIQGTESDTQAPASEDEVPGATEPMAELTLFMREVME